MAIKVTLKNGTVIEGNIDEVNEILYKWPSSAVSTYDKGQYYLSDSKGLMLIRDMHPTHLKNAILKRYQEWLSELKFLDEVKFVQALSNGPEKLLRLIEEYVKKTR